MRRLAILIGLTMAAALPSTWTVAQTPRPDVGAVSTAPHRTRLILRDGSYQVVLSYRVEGKIVRYQSAERDGAEELPYDLVDWDATHAWERRHPATGAAPTQAPETGIDPELLKEEADRAAQTPEVAKDLSLPDLDSVVALDYFHGEPELVPLVQTDGELNRTTGHNVLKLVVNPHSVSHQIVQLKGIEAAVQMHVDQPAIYLRIGDDATMQRGGTPLVVDTHGASSREKPNATGASADRAYVIVRADVRTDARVLVSFNIGMLGSVQKQQDVMETVTEVLPGGHWLKVSPKKPLDFGEYALMEVISDSEVNMGVWDFGVHPVAPENRDVMKPQPKRPTTLERRQDRN